MSLAPGTRFGPYEIVSVLGTGGMGEVYRARDTRLGRDIAVKVLPADAAADQERRDRFEHEARAVAALNHPNIVTIHAVEESDGVPFFTMECIEGKTLRDLIPAHGLPLDQLLKIAIPLTDAVGAAHQRGILHRDLKPANVMVTAEGRVKVLDFGLAKLKEALVRMPDGSQLTRETTGEGRILGTVAYMAPEQAEGKPVDQRSDVFSLGVVLYEMATGRRPFNGDTSVSIISAILKDTPGSVTELRPDLPRDLGKIIRHALTKDPEHRYQTAKDLRNDLESLKEDLDSGEIVGPEPRLKMRSDKRRWVVAAGFVAVAAMTGAAWLGFRLLSPANGSEAGARAFADFTVTPVSTEDVGGVAAVSPDGRYVVYAFVRDGRQGLRVRQVETSATVDVSPPEARSLLGLSFSPDGNRILYMAYPRGRGTADLYEVPVLGGSSRLLVKDVDRQVGFALDGSRFAFIRVYPGRSSSILVANADGTGERTLASRGTPNEFYYAGPAWSPDGRTIAAVAYDGPGRRMAVVSVDPGTGAVTTVNDKRWDYVFSLAWMPDGAALIVAATDLTVSDVPQLWGMTYPGGAVWRITKDVGGYGQFTLSSDARRLAVVRSESRGTLWTGPASNPDELKMLESPSNSVRNGGLGWTADGRILFTASVGGNYDIWSVRPDGSELRRLTTAASIDRDPIASPDNRCIVYRSHDSSGWGLWRMEADGSQPVLLQRGANVPGVIVTADGKTVYYATSGQSLAPMFAVAIEGGKAVPAPTWLPPADEPTARTFGPFAGGLLSPDGNYLLGSFWDSAQGRSRFAIVPSGAEGAAQWVNLPSTVGGPGRAWAADGRSITYVNTVEAVPNLWRQPIDGKPPTRITNYTSRDAIVLHAWSPDGKWLALIRQTVIRQVVLLRDTERRR
jgi:eukaryotic-like serine/threonine-protein kinase